MERCLAVERALSAFWKIFWAYYSGVSASGQSCTKSVLVGFLKPKKSCSGEKPYTEADLLWECVNRGRFVDQSLCHSCWNHFLRHSLMVFTEDSACPFDHGAAVDVGITRTPSSSM